jgi:hypothetical protein
MGHPAIENGTPYTFEPLHLLDEEARPLLVTVIKGTFAIGADGRCRLAEAQVPVNVDGEPYGEDSETSSYRYEPEVAFHKLATDVVMNGHAYPARAGDKEVVAALRVGELQKSARVLGERVWFRGATGISATRPIELDKVPLQYERAFGGWDRTHAEPARHTFEPRNPVGVGYRPSRKFEDGLRLPNIEDVRQPLSSLGDRPPPAGFGFVSPHWQPRAPLAGTFDKRWQDERAPLLPKDFDRRHLNAAPEGLVAEGYLRGDEFVSAIGVTPTGGLAFTLPGAPPPRARIALRQGGDQELATNLDTVIIEPDEGRVMLIWRAHLALRTGPHDVSAIELRAELAPETK